MRFDSDNDGLTPPILRYSARDIRACAFVDRRDCRFLSGVDGGFWHRCLSFGLDPSAHNRT